MVVVVVVVLLQSTRMWPIVSDVALSASLLVTSVSPAKLAEQIEVSLGCGLG